MFSRNRLWRLARRRLFHAALVLFMVSIFAFLLAEIAPGDPFAAERLDSTLSEAAFDRLKERTGIEDPVMRRYGRWLLSMTRGELGFSVTHGRPVADLILPRLGATLTLTLCACTCAWALALFLGTLSAHRPAGLIDRFGLFLSSGLQAMPELLLALLGAVFALKLGLPVSGMASLDAAHLDPVARLVDRLRHLAVPVAVLTLATLPQLLRHVRASMIDALASPYIQAARGRGITRRRLFFGYILPLAANPLISLLGVSFGGLISGSLVVEVVLGWPGLGPLMLEAVFARDLHLVVAGTLFAAAFLLAGNAAADLALGWLDPRLAEQES